MTAGVILQGLQEMLAQDFIVRALLAGTCIAVAAGLVGYFVVLRGQVFVADAQSHTAFAGALAALAFGADLSLGLFAATILGSVAMGGLGGKTSRGRDVAIGVTFAWILGLGVLFLNLYTTSGSGANGTAGVSVLFGSIFGLSTSRAALAAVVALLCSGALLVLARPLLFASVAPELAQARGVPVRWLGAAFMVLLGVTVGEAVQAVGALLIFGLMVTPALCAQLLSPRPYAAMFLSVAFAVGSVVVGVTVSYAVPAVPASSAVIATVVALYVLTRIGRAVRASLVSRAAGTAQTGVAAP